MLQLHEVMNSVAVFMCAIHHVNVSAVLLAIVGCILLDVLCILGAITLLVLNGKIITIVNIIIITL